MNLYLGETFYDQLLVLPKQVVKQIMDFRKKFTEENIHNHSINLEKIVSFKDDSLRTARVNDEYRAIIGVAGKDSYALLYVEHHDEAMAWAKNKRFCINKYTEGFQLITINEVTETVSVPQEALTTYAFSEYSDENLLKIGVPEEHLPLVRTIVTEDDLADKIGIIPDDAFENLYFVYKNEKNIFTIIEEIEEAKAAQCANKRHYVEISDEDLENLINDPEGNNKWQIFLHPSQRLVVEGNFKGSFKVSGGAGTGKTIAALHRLKRLSEGATRKSILYTTYTKSLVDNIKHLADKLKINQSCYDITNVDEIAYKLSEQYKLLPSGSRIDFDCSISDKIWEQIVEENLTEFSAHFLSQEYINVIAYHNLKTESEYLSQSRIGMTKAISRKQKKDIWNLMAIFSLKKKDAKIIDRHELFNVLTDYMNVNNIRPYNHVIADEIQDFSNPELRFIRALVSEQANDLFMVGDPYQHIYSSKPINFGKAGINIKGKRSKRLRVNYRTTEEIKRFAVALVREEDYDDFDGEKETLQGYVSLMHGDKPDYQIFDTEQAEIEAIIEFIKDCNHDGIEYKDIAVAAHKKEWLKPVQNKMHTLGIPNNIMVNGFKNGDADGVTFSSMHNLKGLEFKILVIMRISKNTFPHIPLNWSTMDAPQKKLHLQNEKSLMYVALTRAMQRVLITGVGEMATF